METPNEIFRALGRIEAELLAVARLVSELKNDSSSRLKDHETRIRKLESWYFKAIGFLTLASVLINILIKRFI